MFITRTRTSCFTRSSSASHMRRICRLRPSVSTIRNTRGASRCATHGSVLRPSITMPVRIRASAPVRDRDVDLDHVLLLVAARAQDLVHQLAAVGEQDQALAELVEPADVEDALG